MDKSSIYFWPGLTNDQLLAAERRSTARRPKVFYRQRRISLDTEIGMPLVKTLSIEHALASSICPYCGKTCRTEHIRACPDAASNIEADENIPNERWATHMLAGKVMVLARSRGLCLIEGDDGRAVVPVKSLEFGVFTAIVGCIDDAELADEEIIRIINHLRIKAKNPLKIPTNPDLPIGCRLEVQLGNTIRHGIIKKRRGHVYIVDVDKAGLVNISHKHIYRILG